MSSSLFRYEVKTFACKIVKEEIILQREWIEESESKILVEELVQLVNKMCNSSLNVKFVFKCAIRIKMFN